MYVANEGLIGWPQGHPSIRKDMDEDIVMLFMDGMSITEIADELGLTASTVLDALEDAGVFDEY